MLFISSTPELIRHLRPLKTIVFLFWCLICSIPLMETHFLLKFVDVFSTNNDGNTKFRWIYMIIDYQMDEKQLHSLAIHKNLPEFADSRKPTNIWSTWTQQILENLDELGTNLFVFHIFNSQISYKFTLTSCFHHYYG